MAFVEDNDITNFRNEDDIQEEEEPLVQEFSRFSVQNIVCKDIKMQDIKMQEIEVQDTTNLNHKELVQKLERYDSLCDSVGSEELSSSDSSSEDNCDLLHSSSSSVCSNEDAKKLKLAKLIESRNGRSSSVVSDESETSETGVGGDSGIEDKEPEMVIPTEDQMEKIVTQVEFYFSDSNVAKDKFLLKHIRRNKEGYVSLKLVSSFKKIKQLTKDWRVVAYCIEKVACNIQLNDQKTKIRRLLPLPDIDDSPITCAVLALDLPLEKPTISNVSELLGESGEIAFIRVLRAGGPLPPDVKSFLTKYPCLGEKHCAWIEFETPEAAKLATEHSVEGGMKIVLIVPESQKKQEKQKLNQSASNSRKNSVATPKTSVSSYNNSAQNSQPNSRKSSWNQFNPNFNKFRKNSNASMKSNDFQGSRDGFQGSSRDERPRVLPFRRKGFSMPHGHQPFPTNGPAEPRIKPRPKSKSCVDFPSSSSPPSWVQRHLFAAAAESAASAASPTVGSRPPSTRNSRASLGSLPLSEGIVRFPKGPDGSRGFSRAPSTNALRQITEFPGRST